MGIRQDPPAHERRDEVEDPILAVADFALNGIREESMGIGPGWVCVDVNVFLWGPGTNLLLGLGRGNSPSSWGER
jgi:hypothetical protein